MSFILRSARKVGSLFLFQCIFFGYIDEAYSLAEVVPQQKGASCRATLYISDLDGTLMKNDQTISAFTAEAINMLVKQGLHFSYATARSILTASKITENITAGIPVIVYNGSFIQDSKTREILYSRFFDKTSAELISQAASLPPAFIR